MADAAPIPHMDYLRLTGALPAAEASRIADWLEAYPAAAISISEAPGSAALFGEPGTAAEEWWTECRVEILVPAESGADAPAPAEFEALLAERFGVVFERSVESIADRDWQAEYRRRTGPLTFAGGLRVVPAWCGEGTLKDSSLVLEPEQAFGSGRHPTTRMAIDALAGLSAGRRVLDYGCGSGILAMAAVRYGAHAADGVDIDPVAIACARRNVTRNALDGAVSIFAPDALPARRYDLVVANILLNPLVSLAPSLTAALAPDGTLLMTGVLADQLAPLADAYPAFDLTVAAEDATWVLVTGVRT